jgi:ankyrin repeat protein
VVRLLLDVPVVMDVNTSNQDGYNQLSIAARNGHTVVVRLLLSAPEVDVNARLQTDMQLLFKYCLLRQG